MASKVSLANNPKNYKEQRVFVRRQNRPLNKMRSEAYERLMPLIGLEADNMSEKGDLAPSSLFDKSFDNFQMEIGFGSGEHVHGLIERHPDTGFLAVEPFVNGMAAFLKDLPVEHESNVRVLMDDAMYLANSLEDSCLDALYILNPDPWHKTRHHKRRIVSSDNLNEFARILKPDGRLIMTTDVPYLAEWMCSRAINHPEFRWTANSSKDWKNAPKDWIPTRYQTKGAKGADQMCYLFFEKT